MKQLIKQLQALWFSIPVEARIILSMAGAWVGILILCWIADKIFNYMFPDKKTESSIK